MNVTLVFGLLIGFGMSLAIGANDVANSMATAVGAKAITPKQAVFIAGILEFAGATFFGSQVTETIRKGIVNIELLKDPNIVIIGSMAALIGATLWLVTATIFSWPVSTTHSIVGGMVGYGIAAGGFGAVHWSKVLTITVSWLVAPVLGLIMSFVLFKIISKTTLHGKNLEKKIKIWIPVYLALTFFIISLSFILKALHLSITLKALLYAILLGTAGGIIAFLIIIIKNKREIKNPEMFVEKMFRKAQVVTSCYVALAHGANDVANAIGPVAAIYAASISGTVGSEVEIPRFILAFGGIGIALGVAIWGKRVMKTVGSDITELNNSRGFTIDFATATTVLGASNLGMPVSSTHTVVGSVIGIGLARGVGSINTGIIKEIFMSWVLTVPASAIVGFLMFHLLNFIF